VCFNLFGRLGQCQRQGCCRRCRLFPALPTWRSYIDAIVRAGSADPATWCATKTYCMRALAITTAKGIARVLTRRRLAPPRRPSSNGPKPPSATSLAHLAHITTPLDRAHDAVAPAPRAAEDSFYASTTTSLMQSAAAMVGE